MSSEPESKATEECAPKPRRRAPAWLFALGHAEMPGEVVAEGVTWRFCKLFKHDFFAATGLYERCAERSGALQDAREKLEEAPPELQEAPRKLAVLKIQRTYRLFGMPMKWLGGLVARHEIRVYQTLQGVAGIPEFFGDGGGDGVSA